jgi:O-antigen ligase
MNWKPYLLAILVAFYSQGLTLYFALAGGILGIQSTALTAAFQIFLLLGMAWIIITTPTYRKRLFKINLIDLLYLFFIVLLVADFAFPGQQSSIPDGLLIYVSVYWPALILVRALGFLEIKIFCVSAISIASTTTVLMYGQVMAGTAVWLQGRLVASISDVTGSGNPIILGYTGGFAFLAGIVMLMWAKSLIGKLSWLGISVLGLMVCSFTGTRSAMLSCLLGAVLLMAYFLNVISRKGSSSFRFFSNTISSAGIIVLALVFLTPVPSSTQASSGPQDNSPVVAALEQGLKRFDTLSNINDDQERDASAEKRTEIYASTWELMQKSPILGSGLYSAGMAHNAFLQIAADFGLLGFITFIAPFLYLTYAVFRNPLNDLSRVGKFPTVSPQAFIHSDKFLIDCFMFILWLQVMFAFSFHGDPYRNSAGVCTLGLLSLFSRLKPRDAIST